MRYQYTVYQWQGRRDYQQDFAICLSPVAIGNDLSIGLFGVFDGVGGQWYGEMASSTAGLCLQSALNQELEFIHTRQKASDELLAELAHDLLWTANQSILDVRRRLIREGLDEAYLPATTGIIAVYDQDGHFAVAQMGDSLALYGDSQAQKQHMLMNPHNATHDEQYLQLHPHQGPDSAITRFLGEEELGPQVKCHTFNPGDYLALMSDGIWEIWEQMGQPLNLNKFLSNKNDYDFNDNATMVLLKTFDEINHDFFGDHPRSRWQKDKSPKQKKGKPPDDHHDQ